MNNLKTIQIVSQWCDENGFTLAEFDGGFIWWSLHHASGFQMLLGIFENKIGLSWPGPNNNPTYVNLSDPDSFDILAFRIKARMAKDIAIGWGWAR